MTDKIKTLHPDPAKQGVNIDRAKYDLVKAGIINVLTENEKMKPKALFSGVAESLKGQMDGSIAWYTVSVKLDMEARGEVEHDRKKGFCWLTGRAPDQKL